MKKINIILLLSMAVFSSVAVKAQSTAKGWMNHNIEGAFQIQLTYRNTQIGQLNNVLNSKGIPSVDANNLWINVSMNHVRHNWVMEDGLGLTPMASSEVNNLKTSYSQYQAFFRLGYNLSKNPDFKLYPLAGINFSAAILNVDDKARTQSTSDFSAELLNSTSSKTFFQPNFGIDLGAGFDYAIKLSSKKMDCFEVERSIPIGVRVGYYFNTYAGDWKINDYTLNNGPNQKQGSVFVTFNIGLGYKVKK